MNFFQHQDRSRRNTKILVFYFFLAVLGIIFAIYTLFSLSIGAYPQESGVEAINLSLRKDFFNLNRFLSIAAITSGVILLGSLYKFISLRGGGKVVAESLGGKLVDPHVDDFKKRQLLNVVEEMAIASGSPVPQVYLLEDEPSINAFAAGNDLADAVIGVSSGALSNLSRDELQGVIAHEFSHILNYDMKLNMRLIGVIHGILLIYLIGSRVYGYSVRTAFRSRSRDDGGKLGLIAFSVGVMIIGGIGVLFGRLMQSAISRQREFLADASAVQFTRNPQGIGGALLKIAYLSEGSKINHSDSSEVSHMFFGSTGGLSFLNMFATHPPVDSRVSTILGIERTEVQSKIKAGDNFGFLSFNSDQPQTDPNKNTQEKKKAAINIPGMDEIGKRHKVDEIFGSIGSVVLSAGIYSQIEESLSPEILDLMRDHVGAKACIYFLVLSEDETTRKKQISIIDENVTERTKQIFDKIDPSLQNKFREKAMAVISLCGPTLKGLHEDDYTKFRKIVEKLVLADEVLDLFESSILQTLKRQIDGFFNYQGDIFLEEDNLSKTFKDSKDEVECFVKLVAKSSHDSPAVQKELVDIFNKELGGDIQIDLSQQSEYSNQDLCHALEVLNKLSDEKKGKLVNASLKCFLQDEHINKRESETLRLICASWGVPIPDIF